MAGSVHNAFMAAEAKPFPDCSSSAGTAAGAFPPILMVSNVALSGAHGTPNWSTYRQRFRLSASLVKASLNLQHLSSGVSLMNMDTSNGWMSRRARFLKSIVCLLAFRRAG